MTSRPPSRFSAGAGGNLALAAREPTRRHRDATRRLLIDLAPGEVYNLAAISSVAQSWAEPDLTLGNLDARRAREVLGWAPTVTFGELVGRMVDADLG